MKVAPGPQDMNEACMAFKKELRNFFRVAEALGEDPRTVRYDVRPKTVGPVLNIKRFMKPENTGEKLDIDDIEELNRLGDQLWAKRIAEWKAQRYKVKKK